MHGAAYDLVGLSERLALMGWFTMKKRASQPSSTAVAHRPLQAADAIIALSTRCPRTITARCSRPSCVAYWLNLVTTAPLLSELRRAPPDRGRHALAGDDIAEFGAELGLGRIERADDIEPGMECGAEAGGVSAAIDRALAA
jgi:hypothetical protein